MCSPMDSIRSWVTQTKFQYSQWSYTLVSVPFLRLCLNQQDYFYPFANVQKPLLTICTATLCDSGFYSVSFQNLPSVSAACPSLPTTDCSTDNEIIWLCPKTSCYSLSSQSPKWTALHSQAPISSPFLLGESSLSEHGDFRLPDTVFTRTSSSSACSLLSTPSSLQILSWSGIQGWSEVAWKRSER